MTEQTVTQAAPTDIIAQVTRFICNARRISHIDPETKLFEAKVINSLFVVQLIQFIENDLGVELNDDDLEIANFASVNRIAAFVQAKSEI